MKLTIDNYLGGWLRSSRVALLCLVAAAALAQAPSTTTVTGTVYLANGQPGTGTLVLSWPSFTTAAGQLVVADSMTVTIPTDGFVSINLAPNLGATPAGQYYSAVYYMSDGSTSRQYWVVPTAASATLAQVQSQVMPAAQAVQTVSKAYVDEAIAELTGSELTGSGGTLTGPLYLSGDPTQPLQAADKHYVDTTFSQALPITGGAATGPLTATQLGAAYQVDQFAGADIGAKIQACASTVSPSYGGTCDARNFTGNLSMGSNLTISTANTTVLLPCATIATAKQVIVSAGTRNVALRGCALRGGSAASGSQGGTVFEFSGTGAMIQVGDPAYAVDTPGFHLDNVVINTTSSTSAGAQGLAAYRTQELDLESLYLLGNSNQTGITLDGTGNYTGGTFLDDQIDGFGTAINAIGHQVSNPATTDWLNASTFVRLHIDCPTSGGSPISGTYGINLQQGDGNTFTGGDVESCATALHLGANAQNNTIVGLRNENSTNQVVADAGSSYNNWMTGGTMFTGKLTDNGTRNSFLDTFHRSFNELNGDWYGSQQDATVTNHYRLGVGSGNERGLLDEYQTDYGYRWTTGLSDATGGEQFYQILDQLNNVYRVSIGQYNNGVSSTNNQTVINAAGTGAVVLNGSNNSGTGGVVVGSGGSSASTVATITNAGSAQFNGTLQVGSTAQSAGTMTVRNNADAEVDYYLWPGLTTSQKGSFTYKDWNGNSQWYMLKDASNNWALNSAVGGLDSFKAYQSSNSGDTYVNASNSTGHIRLNYESGSGAETDIYSGSSSNLVAAFLGTTSIKFPGLAASSGVNCLQIDNSGYISNTGSACGSGGGGGSGTVNSGVTNQVAVYSAPGTAVTGSNSLSLPGTVSGSGVQDTMRPWVDTFTIATPVSSTCGGGSDEFAKFCQLGVNASGTYTGNIFRSTGVSGTTVTASVNPFAPYLLTIPAPSIPTSTILQLAPGTVYTVPSELDIPMGGEIDGRSTYLYYGTPRTGTWLEAASGFPMAPVSSQAGNVFVNLGNSSGTTSGTFSAYNKIHNVGVDCMSYPWAVGIEEGQSQQGLDIHGAAVRDCQYGIDVENYGNGQGGAQNHGPIYGNAITPFSLATTPSITGVQVTAGGSYTQAPNVTITGCATNPAATATLTGSAVTAVTVTNSSGNGYGSNCNPLTAAVSFDTTYGSGAAATPAIQMLPVPVGLRMGAVHSTGGGMYYNNWVVGNSYPTDNTTAFTLDDSNEYLIDSYAESTWKAMATGGNTTGSLGGNIILGLRLQPANEPGYAALDIQSTSQNQSLFAAGVNVGASAPYNLTDEEPNGGQIRARVATPAGVAMYVRDGQTVISSNPDIASTGMVLADSYLDCGPSCTSAQYPRQFLPVKSVNGYAQVMVLSDSSQPAGIAVNGAFTTSDTKSVAVAKSGEVPCLFDPSVAVNYGDYVGISSNTVVSGYSIAGCVDLGSAVPTSVPWVIGQVVNLGSYGSVAIPSAPSTSGVSISSSTGGGITYSYVVTSATKYDKTESAPSSAVTTTNGPVALVAGGNNQISGLASPGNAAYNIYRTTMGSSSLPAVTAQCCSSGQVTALLGLPAGSGYTFGPTGVFTGGGCTTEPSLSGPLYVSGGQIAGANFKSFGAGCTSAPTLTLIKSVYETGWIGQTSGTSFVDNGKAGDGSTAPPGGQIAPLVALKVQATPQAGTGNVNGPGGSTVGDEPCWNNTGGTLLSDCGNPASAPAWLRYLGSGADGAESVGSGSAALSGEKFYTTFNIASGATVTVNNWLVVHATGACTINGNILANGATNALNAVGFAGASSGGSGGGSSIGTAGKSSYLSPAQVGLTAANGGGAGAASGGNGQNGGTPSASVQRAMAASGLGTDGMSITGAVSVAGANSGGAAVEGGGGVVLICGSISGTGAIDVAGAPGLPPNANSEGASSGGGGGVVILSSQASGAAFPTIYAEGGAGGQVSVPYAVPGGTSSAPSNANGTTPPILTLGVSSGALSSCTVTSGGSGWGSSPSPNLVFIGGGGSGGTVTPAWSGGAVTSCTASGGSGYTAASYTTAGSGGSGGAGWYAEFSGW